MEESPSSEQFVTPFLGLIFKSHYFHIIIINSLDKRGAVWLRESRSNFILVAFFSELKMQQQRSELMRYR